MNCLQRGVCVFFFSFSCVRFCCRQLATSLFRRIYFKFNIKPRKLSRNVFYSFVKRSEKRIFLRRKSINTDFLSRLLFRFSLDHFRLNSSLLLTLTFNSVGSVEKFQWIKKVQWWFFYPIKNWEHQHSVRNFNNSQLISISVVINLGVRQRRTENPLRERLLVRNFIAQLET